MALDLNIIDFVSFPHMMTWWSWFEEEV